MASCMVHLGNDALDRIFPAMQALEEALPWEMALARAALGMASERRISEKITRIFHTEHHQQRQKKKI